MSLQGYVHQLRPRKELYGDNIAKIQNLLEANLSKADIRKRDNIQVLKDIIDNKTPIETEKGKVSISWLDNSYKIAYENGNLDDAFPSATEVFMTSEGDKLRLTQIVKTDIFGGGRGSGGGASSTKAGESAQCVYLQAIWNNPKTDFNEAELTQAFYQTKTDASLDIVLN